MTDMSLPEPEFSRIVRVRDLPSGGADYDISANEAERAALARRFGLVSLDLLEAAGRLSPRARGVVRYSARLHALVVQTCVATLEPVPDEIDIQVDIVFRPELAAGSEGEVFLDPEEDSEPLVGDSLNLGEIIAEEMVLALNPYPRIPGADPTIGPEPLEKQEIEMAKPFSALAALRRKDGNN